MIFFRWSLDDLLQMIFNKSFDYLFEMIFCWTWSSDSHALMLEMLPHLKTNMLMLVDLDCNPFLFGTFGHWIKLYVTKYLNFLLFRLVQNKFYTIIWLLILSVRYFYLNTQESLKYEGNKFKHSLFLSVISNFNNWVLLENEQLFLVLRFFNKDTQK